MKPSIFAVFLCAFAVQPVFAQFQSPKIILSYNGLTQFGRNNRDSVERGLGRLGIPKFDTIDRNQTGSDTINYTPYGILIWASGDPTIDVIPGEPTGQAGLSAKEIGEVEKFLKTGQSDCKKTLVIAGQNIAYEHGFLMPNGILIDTEFLQSWLHVKFVADSPDSDIYRGRIVGQQPAYWTFPDSMISSSPDVVSPAIKTPQVGPVVNELAYTYSKHTLTPSDSGAGISFYNPLINTIFYAFDWADPIQTFPQGNGDTTSGTTRVLAAAFAFVRGHGIQQCTNSVQPKNAAKPSLELNTIVPNPAQDRAEVFFTLPERSFVTIYILDILGRIVRTEFEQISMNAGAWSKTLDLTNIPSGNYTCELVTNSNSAGASVVTENFIVQ
jgi:hypothetical protein